MEEQPAEQSPRRPVYLVLALVALMLAGFQISYEGYEAVRAAHDPFFIGQLTQGMDELTEAVKKAQLEAIAAHAGALVPIAVAKLVLGSALLAFAARGLFGRASISLMIQLTLGNMLALGLGFALGSPVRAAMAQAVAGWDHAEAAQMSHLVPWMFGMWLVIQLATLGLCVFGLSRPAARLSLEPAPEQVEEP